MLRLRQLLVALTLTAVSCSEGAPPEVVVETTVARRVERAEGFDGERVRLAVLADLSGPGAEIDRERLAGIEVFWSAVNAAGGFAGRFPVELVILDHGGDPDRAVELLAPVGANVAAVAFASEVVVDALLPVADDLGLLVVPAASTAQWEAAPSLLTFGLPVDVAVLSVFDSLADASFCVVADQSVIGSVVVAATAPSADLLGIPVPAVYEAASPEQVASLVDASCSHVLLETAPGLARAAATAIPQGRVLVRRSAVAHGVATSDEVDVLVIDDGTQWRDDASTGMDQLIAALEAHAPDADPDPRLRAGYASQIELAAILSYGFESGDVRRAQLREAVNQVGLVEYGGLAADLDRSAQPPELPRQLKLFTESGLAGGLGWGFLGGHRAAQADELAQQLGS